MSLSNCGRWLSVAPLAGVEQQGRGPLGSGCLAVGMSYSLPSDSRFVQRTYPLPSLQSRFHPGQGSGGRSLFVAGQGSNRAGSPSLSGLLQPVIHGEESLRSLEAGHRPLATESEGSKDILQDGDSPVRTSVSTSWRLDGVSRLEGCVLAGSNASGVSQVHQIRGVWEGVPIQGSLLWLFHSSSGFHTGHDSCFGISSQDKHSVTSIPRQLVDPGLLSEAGSPCSGDSSSALQFVGNSRQLGEVAADSNSAHGLPGSSFGPNLFQGFACPEDSREASLNWRRILVLRKTACVIFTGAPWGAVLNDPARSGRKAPDAIATVPSPAVLGSGRSDCSGVVDSRNSSGSRMGAGLRASRAWRGSRLGVPSARLVVRHIRRGLGSASRRRGCFRPLVSRRVGRFNQRQGALGHRESSSLFRSTDKELVRSNFCGQLYSDCLSSESWGNTISSAEFHRSANLTMVGDSSSSVDSPIHHGPSQCFSGLVVSSESSVRVRMDTQDRGVSRAPEEVAGVHRPVCHLTQSPISQYLPPFHDQNALGTDALLQSWDGWQAYAFPPWSLTPAVLKKLRSSSAVLLTIVASYWPQRSWFPDLLDLVVGGPVTLPQSRDLLRQPHFHRLHLGMSGLLLHAWRLSSDLSVLEASPSMSFFACWLSSEVLGLSAVVLL